MVSLDKAEIGPPLDPALIDTIEMTSGVYVPDKIKQFYLLANGINISWKLKPGLKEAELQKIYEKEEEPGYDYKRPLGSLRLLPLEKVLINSWKPPKASDPGGNDKFSFAGKDYTYASFGAMLKPFDLFHVNNDLQCMAFIADPAGTQWKVMMLDDYYADWHQSKITDFETYLKAMCKTWFTVPSRKKLFGKYRGDKEDAVTLSDLPDRKLHHPLPK